MPTETAQDVVAIFRRDNTGFVRQEEINEFIKGRQVIAITFLPYDRTSSGPPETRDYDILVHCRTRIETTDNQTDDSSPDFPKMSKDLGKFLAYQIRHANLDLKRRSDALWFGPGKDSIGLDREQIKALVLRLNNWLDGEATEDQSDDSTTTPSTKQNSFYGSGDQSDDPPVSVDDYSPPPFPKEFISEEFGKWMAHHMGLALKENAEKEKAKAKIAERIESE